MSTAPPSSSSGSETWWLAPLNACDNLPHDAVTPAGLTLADDPEPALPLHVTQADGEAGTIRPIGWIRSKLGDELQRYASSEEGKVVFRRCHKGGRAFWCFSDGVLSGGCKGLTEAMGRLAAYWKAKGMFSDALDGWRNELYGIYADPRSSYFSDPPASGSTSDHPYAANHVFSVERAACALFGLVTFGVHMTIYEGEGQDMRIWVPRRSATKPTWPSKLDNSVAGGIPVGMDVFECMIKECDEEASLPEDLVRARARAAGQCTYFYINEHGWPQPEYEYIYDLQMPPQEDPSYVKPHPHDDEVESFELMPVSGVLDILRGDPTQFKPNCALMLVDFLARHGFIGKDQRGFEEIARRCHRDLGIPVPVGRDGEAIRT